MTMLEPQAGIIVLCFQHDTIEESSGWPIASVPRLVCELTELGYRLRNWTRRELGARTLGIGTQESRRPFGKYDFQALSLPCPFIKRYPGL
jgi:hypothetical protein